MTEDANKDDNNTPQPLEQSVEVVGTAEAAVDDKLKNLTQLVYILQAISLAVGLTAIAGLILNYLKRDEVKGTYLEDHFRWQIKTFWYALVGVK